MGTLAGLFILPPRSTFLLQKIQALSASQEIPYVGHSIMTYRERHSQSQILSYSLIYTYQLMDRGGTAVKVLCYKSEGRWFDPS